MNRISKYLGPGIVAGVIVACSEPIAQTAARIMQDAGDALAEAGGRLAGDASHTGSRDGGRHRADATIDGARDSGRGGGLLRDASHVLSDASRGMTKEASAQSCASCLPSGAVKVVTADSDPAQIVSGFETNATTNGNWSERVAGPFIVRSLIPAHLGQDATPAVAYADPGACASSRTMLAQVSVGAMNDTIDNGRYLVPKGKVLCVSGVVLSSTLYIDYSWSGFKPYE